MPTLPEVHRRGPRGQQPAASDVSVGALYFVTDEGKTERSNGAVWESYYDTAVSMRSSSFTEDVGADLQRQIDELRARLDAL